MPIDWERTSRDEFDALCESLIRRTYSNAKVQVYDGSGGDRGRDVVVTEAGKITIFQLKHFIGRIPARSPNRRSQVASSLNSARAHQPDCWVLVVPTTLNQTEHDWFEKLRSTVDFDIDLWDKTALNDNLAKCADLVVQHLRRPGDYVLEVLRAANAEKAVLADASDLDDRIRTLAVRVDELDPDWTWDFARQGDTVVRTLVARHAGGSETSPITIDLEVAFTADNDGVSLREQWTAAIRYGAPGRVSLPEGAVQRFAVHGPPFIEGERGQGGLEILPEDLDILSQPARLRVTDASGAVLHEVDGRTDRWGRGTDGHHVTASLAGITVGITVDEQAGGTLDLSLDLQKCDNPVQALQAIRAVLDMRPPHRVEIDVTAYRCSVKPFEEEKLDVEALRKSERVMQDLAVVAEALDVLMPVPEHLSSTELRDLRRTARLLRGEAAELHTGPLTATLSGQNSDSLQAVLTGDTNGAFLVLGPHEVEIAGRVLQVGSAAVYARAATVRCDPSVRKALRQGKGAGKTFQIRPVKGQAWLTQLAEEFEAIDFAKEPLAE